MNDKTGCCAQLWQESLERQIVCLTERVEELKSNSMSKHELLEIIQDQIDVNVDNDNGLPFPLVKWTVIHKLQDQIDELKSWQDACNIDLEYLDSENLINRIKSLEQSKVNLVRYEVLHEILARIEHLEKSIQQTKKPHKCPVCDGKGYWKGIEDNILCGGQCIPCDSQGIVWG